MCLWRDQMQDCGAVLIAQISVATQILPDNFKVVHGNVNLDITIKAR